MYVQKVEEIQREQVDTKIMINNMIKKIYLVTDSEFPDRVYTIQETSLRFNFLCVSDSKHNPIVTFFEKTGNFVQTQFFTLSGNIYKYGDASIRLASMSDPKMVFAQIDYAPMVQFESDQTCRHKSEQIVAEIISSALFMSHQQIKDAQIKIPQEVIDKMDKEAPMNYQKNGGVNEKIMQQLLAIIS
ncbi:hypothetical protein FGO68_gene16786 [Halteria grandinella]|uniref:Uncharacterized protein n=1 Tax=Halteria grandinella TaxID=5974 RepID=A0A8J8NKZ4_HALGN|nr:hypothetical protein FGO68_gene16786 [Halteria grandinella]